MQRTKSLGRALSSAGRAVAGRTGVAGALRAASRSANRSILHGSSAARRGTGTGTGVRKSNGGLAMRTANAYVPKKSSSFNPAKHQARTASQGAAKYNYLQSNKKKVRRMSEKG